MKKKYIYNIVTGGLITALFYFLLKFLIANWQDVRNYDFHFNYFYLVLSVLLVIIAKIINSLVARYILKRNNFIFSRFEVFKIETIAELGKYIPGKIFFYLTRLRLYGNRIPKKIFAAYCIIEGIIYIFASFLFSVLIIYYYLPGLLGKFIPIIIILTYFVFIFSPKLYYWLINYCLKLIKKRPIGEEIQLKTRDLVFCTLVSIVSWFIWGSAFFFFLSSLITIDIKYFFFINAFFVFSYNASILIAILPAGLGVRESILTVFLSKIFSFELAIFISLITRLWMVVGDLIAALFSAVLFLCKKKVFGKNGKSF